jgi:hypothetical protein
MAKKPATIENLNEADKQISALLVNLGKSEEQLTGAAAPSRGVVGKNYDKLIAKAKDSATRTHKLSVDFGGGAVAQISNEVINGLIRAWADWRPTGWAAHNADLLQSAPHVILGMGVYLTELALRSPKKMPTMSREMASQAALIFSNLGMSNLARALRTRWNESKGKPVELEAMRAENEAMKARLAALAKP